MKATLVLFALIFLGLAEVIPHIGPVDSHAPLIYRVQLEDDPKTRWAPIIKDYNATLHRFL